MSILVTGGLGYIGSHTVVELLNLGYDVIVIDNLCNSRIEMYDRIKEITGKDFKFYIVDLLDKEELHKIFVEHTDISDVIHFAGLKAVGESCQKPLLYYETNIMSSINLVNEMVESGVKNIIFSSSATVYGTPKRVPIFESDEIGGTTNPYGTTKLIIEGILQDLAKVHPEMNIGILRNFNPIGAHESGIIGEAPNGIPNNLMPYITQVAVKQRPHLTVFGNDYDTVDGTGVRDYIHVVDLAKGHLKAIEYANNMNGSVAINLGTGTGYSVLEMVNAYKDINNVDVPYKIAPRRDGDIAECYADPTKAKELLSWKANLTLEDMVKSAYDFIKNNNK